MFPEIKESHKPNARELVDDAASSICIDNQDYFELEEAMEVLQEQVEPENDFEKYNQAAARQIVLNWDYDASTIELESLHDYGNSQPNPNPNSSPHIQYDDFKLMVLGGCVSLASMFEIQEAISRDGPMGSIIGCTIGFSIYLVSANGPIEMMSFFPMESYGGYVREYLHSSLGFALDCTYWWSCIATASQEAVIALLMLTQFSEINTPDINYAVWMVYLIFLMAALHLTNNSLRIALASFCGLMAVTMIFITTVLLILVITGKITPTHRYVLGKFMQEGCGGIVQNLYCGKFQLRFGKASGVTGRFCQVLDSTINSFRAAGTTDKVYTLSYTLRNPRKSIPKTVKYIWARILIVFLVPTMFLALGSAMNDPLYSVGKSVIAVKQHHRSGPDFLTTDSTSTDAMCPYQLSNWKHFENLRTFIPMSIPFIRGSFCKINRYISASSIFFGATSCLWYLIAANEALTSLSRVKPLSNWMPRHRSHRRIASLKVLNLVILVVHILGCWFGINSFYKFISVAQTSYVFVLMSLLNITYVCFYNATQAQPDGYVDRDDPYDWPYRALGGHFFAYCTAFLSLLCMVAQWPLYGGAFYYWPAWQFTASMFPLVLTMVLSVIHWLVYRPKFVRVEDIDLVGAKRSLDEQEWVEDRVFRRGTWAGVYRWSGHLKHILLAPIKKCVTKTSSWSSKSFKSSKSTKSPGTPRTQNH